ncbi:hypothetical protein [Anderseniella sp. Alg231-50]|uniref:hypothetical protein n=1 Tax=Anderseniella sp. Alg231-50 TaxID=1922226 RepID=UPI000D556A41
MSEEVTTGRGIAGLVGALGWLAVLGGGGLLGYGVYLLMQSDFGVAAGGPLMAGGAATLTLGLLCVINATMAKAMIITANNTAKLLDSSPVAGSAMMVAPTGDDDLPPMKPIPDADGEAAAPEPDGTEDQSAGADEASAQKAFEPAPYAPPPAPIIPDTSDPRGWPLAIDEFNIDGHLAMTLEDGTVAVETPLGWRRLQNLDAAHGWLAQQPR